MFTADCIEVILIHDALRSNGLAHLLLQDAFYRSK